MKVTTYYEGYLQNCSFRLQSENIEVPHHRAKGLSV